MPRPQSKHQTRRSRQKYINNLFHSAPSSSYTKEKENKEISPNSSYAASLTPLVRSSNVNMSILQTISVNTPLSLRRRHYSSTSQASQQRSISISRTISFVPSAPETTSERYQGLSSRKFKNYEQEWRFFHDDDEYDFYQIIYNSCLFQLMRNTSCQLCFRIGMVECI